MDKVFKIGIIILLLTTSINGIAQSEIIGRWKLNSYGYSSNSGMNFSFVKGIDYEFKNDNTGYLINNNDTTNFVWKQKKKNLTITFSEIIYEYKIVELSSTKLMIVDKNPGKDENKSYVAYEKGLIFEKKKV